jgi:putative Mn2+ efflux pump MntP
MDMDHLIQIVTVNAIAAGLAMDAFAVSIVNGAIFKELHIRHALRMAFFFGAFQAIMPLLGYAAGNTFAGNMTSIDHWIAFALLVAIGGKMIYESFKIRDMEKKPQVAANLITLLALSIATSIDALAVGFTLTLITDFIFRAVVTIGLVTFVLSYVGYELGKRFGHFFENKIEIAGGLILITIGFKILISHIMDQSVF